MTLVLPVCKCTFTRLATRTVLFLQREGCASPGKSRLLNKSIEGSPVLLSLVINVVLALFLLVLAGLDNGILHSLCKGPIYFIHSFTWIFSRLLSLIRESHRPLELDVKRQGITARNHPDLVRWLLCKR